MRLVLANLAEGVTLKLTNARGRTIKLTASTGSTARLVRKLERGRYTMQITGTGYDLSVLSTTLARSRRR